MHFTRLSGMGDSHRLNRVRNLRYLRLTAWRSPCPVLNFSSSTGRRPTFSFTVRRGRYARAVLLNLFSGLVFCPDAAPAHLGDQ